MQTFSTPAVRFTRKILVTLPLLLASNAHAWDTSKVVSVGLGAFDSDVYAMTLQPSAAGLPSRTVNLDASGNQSYRLAWGLEEESVRFTLEYYYSTMDINDGAGGARSSSDSLYYSGYWTPKLIFGLQGILGAGVGYHSQEFKALGAETGNRDFSSNGLTYKLSIGAQYEVVPKLNVFFLIEQHDFKDDEDTLGQNGDASTLRRLEGSQPGSFSIGASYSY